jgi:hypothetical protein
MNNFVFDFDCTLTYTHFYYFTNDLDTYCKKFKVEQTDKIKNLQVSIIKYLKEDTKINLYLLEQFIELIFGGNDRLKMIKQFLCKLNLNNVYIASRGNKNDICKCVDLLGIKISHNNIFGNETPKVNVINNLINKGNVFYVDDDRFEHIEFIRNLLIIDKFPMTIAQKNNNNYVFMNSLMKEGSGLTLEQINLILHFYNIN